MGFSKNKTSKEIDIAVTHAWHPGVQFVFTFPKQLPQSALDAEKSFLGLKDAERAEEYRKALVVAVARMSVKPPEGFDDLVIPKGFASEEEQIEAMQEAMIEYFNDPEQPELEAIIVSAWKAYKVAALPYSFLRGAESRSA